MPFMWLAEDPFTLPNGTCKQKRNSQHFVLAILSSPATDIWSRLVNLEAFASKLWDLEALGFKRLVFFSLENWNLLIQNFKASMLHSSGSRVEGFSLRALSAIIQHPATSVTSLRILWAFGHLRLQLLPLSLPSLLPLYPRIHTVSAPDYLAATLCGEQKSQQLLSCSLCNQDSPVSSWWRPHTTSWKKPFLRPNAGIGCTEEKSQGLIQ